MAWAAIPLVEFISQPLSAQQLLPGQSNILYFTLRNNTAVNFPLKVLLSSPLMTVSSIGNTCGTTLQAKSVCDVSINVQAPSTSQSLSFLVQFDYQGRAPLSQRINYSVNSELSCRLLPIASYQSAFCQRQYQNVLLYILNLFNPRDQDVILGQAPGGVVALFQQRANQDFICYVSCGRSELHGAEPNEKTVFELASVTKTFTGAILGESEHLGAVAPLVSVNPFLPSGTWHGQSFSLNANEQAVTFQQLATFSGGVCFSDAPDVVLSDSTDKKQSDFVKDINQLNPADSTCYAPNPPYPPSFPPVYGAPDYVPTLNYYSNSSVGLLGQVLMSIDNYHDMDQANFNSWMCGHILVPAGMKHTTACLPDEITHNTCTTNVIDCDTSEWGNLVFAKGYHLDGSHYHAGDAFPYVPWAAAGNLRSNAEDMIQYLKLNLGINSGNNPQVLNIMAGMQLAHLSNYYLIGAGNPTSPRLNIGSQKPLSGGQGYGWVCDPNSATPNAICGKIGGHENFRSFVGFNKTIKSGVVILINSGNGSSGGLVATATPPSPSDVGVNLIKSMK